LSKKPKKSAAKAGKKSAGTKKFTGPMDVNLLQSMVELMSANDLNTVDVRDGDKRVILKRGAVVVQQAMSAAAPAHYAHAPSASAPSASSPAAAAASAAEAEDAKLVAIKSPMVGTFYSAASPDAKPFVSVGTRVDEETDVCIIEAMKVFNNIKAETRGTIAKVLVDNGETVEFGQTLYLVKP